VLVVVTAYALIRISVGSTFIACILTIVGYSVNDTIVIFDRIRENLHGIKKYSADELADIANESLTQTLSRSINTSLTTFVMVLLLFIFGHTSIREFSLPLMVGVLCGTYSSICIATELWYVMKLYLGKSAIKKQAAAPAKVSKKAKN
jgi:SecD/SecF fusion protein